MSAIQQEITVKNDGLLEVRSPELRSGDIAHVTVLIKSNMSPEPDLTHIKEWRQLSGIFKGDCGSLDNESIDADLAKEYGSTHEPEE